MTKREVNARLPRRDAALALAIERREWERVSLYLALGFAEALRRAPPGTIDDLIALFADVEDDREV